MSEASGQTLDPLACRLIKGDKKDWYLRPKLRPLQELLAGVQHAQTKGFQYFRLGGRRFEAVLVGTILEDYALAIGNGMEFTEEEAGSAGSAYGRWFAQFNNCSFEIPLEMLPIPRAIMADDKLRALCQEAGLREISIKAISDRFEVLFSQWRIWNAGSGKEKQDMPAPYKECFNWLYGATLEADRRLVPSHANPTTGSNVAEWVKPAKDNGCQFMDELETIENLREILKFVNQNSGTILFYQDFRLAVTGLLHAWEKLEERKMIVMEPAMGYDKRKTAASQGGQYYGRMLWELYLVYPSWPLFQWIESSFLDDLRLRCAFLAGCVEWLMEPELPICRMGDPKIKIDKIELLRKFRESFF